MEDTAKELRKKTTEEEALYSSAFTEIEEDLPPVSKLPLKHGRPFNQKDKDDELKEKIEQDFSQVEIDIFANKSLEGETILQFLKTTFKFVNDEESKKIKPDKKYYVLGEICIDFNSQQDKKLLQLMKSM